MDHSDTSITADLLEEQHLFNQTRVSAEAQQRMEKFMQLGGQSRVGELDLDSIIRKLSDG